MTDVAGVAAEVAGAPLVPTSPAAAGERAVRRPVRAFLHHPYGMVAGGFLVVVAVLAVFAPLVAPYAPLHQDLVAQFQGPSASHILGTDDVGRDTFTRLLYGARVSLLVGVLSVAVSLVIALPFGFVAGYRGGLVDRVVQIVVDVLLSIPPLVLVFAIAGVLGPSVTNLVISLAVFFTPLFVRLVRSETAHLRASQLVEAERALGISEWRIAWRHVLPNIASALGVQAAANIGVAIIAEAAISFLGLGVRPPSASWGVMLNTAFQNITLHPWLVVAPAVAVLLTVVAFNLLADALREVTGRRSR